MAIYTIVALSFVFDYNTQFIGISTFLYILRSTRPPIIHNVGWMVGRMVGWMVGLM